MSHKNNMQSSKEFFDVVGDAPDPYGTSMRGVAPGYNLTQTAIGHPVLFYSTGHGDFVLVADVYKLEGVPMYVHLMCPICRASGKQHAALRIVEGNKQVHYEPGKLVRPPANWSSEEITANFPNGLGGRLSVSEFGCSWEIDDARRNSFPGLTTCPWNVVIDNNIVRDVKR